MNRTTHYPTDVRLFAVAAVVAWAIGCGDGSSPSAPPPDPPRPTSVAVSPATVEFSALGATVQLTADVRDQNGQAMAGTGVTWASSNAGVATVSSSGLVTASGNGETKIAVGAGSASGGATVTVAQIASVVTVAAAADTLVAGDTLRLSAEAFDATGHAVAEAAFAWSTSDAAVATVDSGGLVSGVAEGTAVITAAAGRVEGMADIVVEENPDRAVLAALYEATGGQNWVNNDNWLTDRPLGEWYGVGTDGAGRVVSLDLSGEWDFDAQKGIPHGLRGAIPVELGNLVNLTLLNLEWNELTGPIPVEMGKLARLKWLYVRGNRLSGPLPPELGNLTSLIDMRLDGNDLSGPIPAEFGKLANLTFLDLGGNALSGPVPAELGDLADLKQLRLGWNDLSGLIPPELGDLASLTHLVLASNDLSGPIPDSFLGLTALETFDFFGNRGLCIPDTTEFVAWREGITETSGPTCNVTVRAVYALPTDREYLPRYRDGISKALLRLQTWYGEQLGGPTFRLHDTIPDRCDMPEDHDYYRHGGSPRVWDEVLAAVQRCFDVKHNSAEHVWLVFADVDERPGECDDPTVVKGLGRGGSGLAMVSWWDLEGVSDPNFELCPYGVQGVGKWIGGVGHELGHAFGLPHPPGCEEGRADCAAGTHKYDALMWYGFHYWPGTYLLESEKEYLRATPAFR